MPNNYVFDYDANDHKSTIYGLTTGNTCLPVQVDSEGRVVVTGVVSGHTTSSSTQTGLSVDSSGYSLWPTTGVDVSQDTMVTFAVYPTNSDVKIKIQVSPDNSSTAYWKDDVTATVATYGNMATLVTKTYLKYAALAYTANVNSASLNVWYQTQS
jgi:hypothetical protein